MSVVEPSDGCPSGNVWRKSTRSQVSNCVEVALPAPGTDMDVVAVRDSKHPDGAVLTFNRRSWLAFLAATKSGEFDRA